jgi:hypothetical protein
MHMYKIMAETARPPAGAKPSYPGLEPGTSTHTSSTLDRYIRVKSHCTTIHKAELNIYVILVFDNNIQYILMDSLFFEAKVANEHLKLYLVCLNCIKVTFSCDNWL